MPPLDSSVIPYMLKSLRFPFLYAIELLLWLLLLAGFASTVSFLAAMPITSLGLQGKSLPPSWEASVPNHGRFVEGFLVSSHPYRFGLGLALLAISAVALYLVSRAQVAQRQSADHSRKIAHNIARFIVAAALVAVGYCVVTQVLVGVSPA